MKKIICTLMALLMVGSLTTVMAANETTTLSVAQANELKKAACAKKGTKYHYNTTTSKCVYKALKLSDKKTKTVTPLNKKTSSTSVVARGNPPVMPSYATDTDLAAGETKKFNDAIAAANNIVETKKVVATWESFLPYETRESYKMAYRRLILVGKSWIGSKELAKAAADNGNAIQISYVPDTVMANVLSNFVNRVGTEPLLEMASANGVTLNNGAIPGNEGYIVKNDVVYYNSKKISNTNYQLFLVFYVDRIDTIEEGGILTEYTLREYYGYAKDDKHVYYKGDIIPGADPFSFGSLSYSYAFDKNHVYYKGKVIPNADVLTFKVRVELDRIGDRAYDKNRTYFNGN